MSAAGHHKFLFHKHDSKYWNFSGSYQVQCPVYPALSLWCKYFLKNNNAIKSRARQLEGEEKIYLLASEPLCQLSLEAQIS